MLNVYRKELPNLYSSPNITRLTIRRERGCTGYLASQEGIKNTCRMWREISERKRTLDP